MAKIVCVLYPDPINGHPRNYARDTIPTILSYPDGETAPTPHAIDFKAGELLDPVALRKIRGDLPIYLFSGAKTPSGSNCADSTH